jgi:hypothetical protein
MDPIDIWRSAQIMVKQHAAMAPAKCRERAVELAVEGDDLGAQAWEAIASAAEEMLDASPPTSIPSSLN